MADPTLDEICAEIRYWHRRRCYWMPLRIAADQQLGWFIKNDLGWRKSLPKDDRDRIAEQTEMLIAAGQADHVIQTLEAKGDLTTKERRRLTRARKSFAAAPPVYALYRSIIVTSMMAREPAASAEDEARAHMERLAMTLPAWRWAEPVAGFGALSLAVIVGEAGNLSNYPEAGKPARKGRGALWKRMGVAVIGDGTGASDVRQGRLRKGAPKDVWTLHGYNAIRRSKMAVIGESLVKQGEHYREVYLARKDYERRKAEEKGLIVAPSAKIPEERKTEFISDGHIHKRAQRYMEKRLLRDLLAAWRRADTPERVVA